MRKKILIADCQVFQEPAWHRGMGKYSLALLEGLFNDKDFRSQFELKLLFTSHLPMEESMTSVLKESLPGVEQIVLDLPIYSHRSSLIKIQKKCQEVVDEFIGDNMPTDDVTFMIMSLFLQYACPVYPSQAKKILLYYDLIMLQYFRMYLGTGPSEQHFAHYRTLFESDYILSISKTVANDLTIYLGIEKDKIVNIDGAPIKRLKAEAKPTNVKVESPFILMPSGGDPRKNNHRAVKGFAKFNESNGNNYKLVLTSMFGEGMRRDLRKISDDIIFTGNVEETELAWLYENCEAVLFAPEYEGLGLPILEAADHGKPVACSDISVFREMSQAAFYYFDHMSPDDIARSLADTLNKVSWNVKKKEYPLILKEYSWNKTVEKTTKALFKPKYQEKVKKKKLAILAPNIQTDSFVGYLAALRYPSYLNEYEVDYYYDFGISPMAVRPNHIAFTTTINSAMYLTAEIAETYDRIIAYVQDDDDSTILVAKILSLRCDIELFSTNLSNVFKHMQENRIITNSRYELEEEINNTLNQKHFLGSVLSNSCDITQYGSGANNNVQKASKLLRHEGTINTKQIFSLPQLPYAISKATTSSRLAVYVSSKVVNAKDAVDSLKTLLDGESVDILFGASCKETIEKVIRMDLDSSEIINGPTDFELVSMIQRAKGFIILSGDSDSESLFVMSRCMQLGTVYDVIEATSNNKSHDFSLFSKSIRESSKG